MWHADLPHLPCLLAKMWCISGITTKNNMTIPLTHHIFAKMWEIGVPHSPSIA